MKPNPSEKKEEGRCCEEVKQELIKKIEGMKKDDTKAEHFDLSQTGYNQALDDIISYIQGE